MESHGNVFRKNQTGTQLELVRISPVPFTLHILLALCSYLHPYSLPQAKITKILRCLDPAFYDYLRMREAINLFFAYRWVLLLFKREFVLTDTIALWETFFSRFVG